MSSVSEAIAYGMLRGTCDRSGADKMPTQQNKVNIIGMDINDIVEAIDAGRVVPSRHSLNEAAVDNLAMDEIYFSVVEGGEIIEDYPDAYPLPVCLVLGIRSGGRSEENTPCSIPHAVTTILKRLQY